MAFIHRGDREVQVQHPCGKMVGEVGLGLRGGPWADPRRGRRGTARGWPGGVRSRSPGAAGMPFRGPPPPGRVTCPSWNCRCRAAFRGWNWRWRAPWACPFLGFFASRFASALFLRHETVLCRVSPHGGMPAGPLPQGQSGLPRDAPGAMIVGEGAGGPFGPRGAVLKMGMPGGARQGADARVGWAILPTTRSGRWRLARRAQGGAAEQKHPAGTAAKLLPSRASLARYACRAMGQRLPECVRSTHEPGSVSRSDAREAPRHAGGVPRMSRRTFGATGRSSRAPQPEQPRSGPASACPPHRAGALVRLGAAVERGGVLAGR